MKPGGFSSGSRALVPTLARAALLSVAVLGVSGCPSAVGPPSDDASAYDGGIDASAIDAGSDASACTPTSCDDGLYCNGTEQCTGGACVAGTAPCAAASCDEAQDRCACTPPDADGDGSAAVACGGTDCDDANAFRHPGAQEVCDVAGVDEDCDPSTFGFRDQDGDGAADAACCNHEGGVDRCGTDCNDAAPGVSPTSVETCNTVDDDCDAATDEGVRVTCWLDADHDSFALAGATPMQLCACGAGTTATNPAMIADCDDIAASISPAVPEVCGNGVDDDCNGVTDVGSAWSPDCDGDGFGDPAGATVTSCAAPGTRPPSCTEATPSWSTDARDCNDHVATVRPGANDVCNGVDDDCNPSTVDGATDPGCAPGVGTCFAGACCRGCIAGGVCHDGAESEACGAHGGACADCGGCIACTAGVCTTPFPDTTVCRSGTGRCLAGACCTGCVSGSACMAGSAGGACGFEGNACSSCASCNAASGTCTGLAGGTCATPIEITLAAGETMDLPVDTCSLPNSQDATGHCDVTWSGPDPLSAPVGTQDVVIRGAGGRSITVRVDTGWSIMTLDDQCGEYWCTNRGMAWGREPFLIERLDGGCGRVTLHLTGR